jgi:hypothetical protein
VIKARENPVILDAIHKSPLFYPEVVLRAGILQNPFIKRCFTFVRQILSNPQLARMAHDIFTVPVSSVASESAFGLSKTVITPNRSSLKPKMVEALMCLQDWYCCKLQKKEGMK